MILYYNDSNKAAFWFAAEEYIMREMKPDEPVLMLWSTEDTVMAGANQVIEAECDVDYTQSEGIEVIRRSSGGGAIFTDEGTLQVTVILPYEDNGPKSVARKWIVDPVVAALAGCGVSAYAKGRNDILIDGKKVSGIAQYISDGYICSHCSLLLQTDLTKLAKSLTTDRAKFTTKAVPSEGSSVANIIEYIPGKDIQSFFSALAKSYGREEEIENCAFDDDEIDQIETIMWDKYLDPGWLFGREPAFTFTNKKTFPGGTIEVFLDVKGGIINEAKITGDFLALLPISELEQKLVGTAHRADSLSEVLDAVNLKLYLGKIKASDFLEVLL